MYTGEFSLLTGGVKQKNKFSWAIDNTLLRESFISCHAPHTYTALFFFYLKKKQ